MNPRRLYTVLIAASFLTGCSGSTKQMQMMQPGDDLATAGDLAGPPATPDLSTADLTGTPPQDLAGQDLTGAVFDMAVDATLGPLATPVLTGVNGDNQVSLSWLNVLHATSYSVYLSKTPGGPYNFNASSAGTGDVFIGSNCDNFYFVVKATAPGYPDSAFSNEVQGTPQTALSCWTQLRSAPAYRGVAANGMTTIAVGDGGAIKLSTNGGTSWSPVAADAARPSFKAAAFGAGQFVAVGANRIWHSDATGTAWSQATLPAAFSFISSVGFGNGQFVALGYTFSGGAVNYSLTSSDGVNWTIHTSPMTSTPHAVTFGGGVWVGVGDGGQIVHSSDGVNWTLGTGTTSVVFTGVTYGHVAGTINASAFVAVATQSGGIWASTNGAAWTKINAGNQMQLNAVATTGTSYVAAGDSGTIVTSADGNTWSAITTPYTDNGLLGILYNGSKYIVVGKADTQLTTTDGVSFTQASLDGDLRSLAASAGSIVAVGSSGIITRSTDGGAHWSTQFKTLTDGFRQVAFGAGAFSAITSAGAIWTSADDGATWQSKTSPFASSPGSPLPKLTFANGLFIAENGNLIATSADGNSWTLRYTDASGSTSFVGVTYGSSFVAVAYGGLLVTSADGLTWARSGSSVTGASTLSALGFGSSTYVAVGNGVWTSPNAVTWTQRLNSGFQTSVVYGNSAFVATDYAGVDDSADGITWRSDPVVYLGGSVLNQLLVSGTHFYGAGDNGAVYRK